MWPIGWVSACPAPPLIGIIRSAPPAERGARWGGSHGLAKIACGPRRVRFCLGSCSSLLGLIDYTCDRFAPLADVVTGTRCGAAGLRNRVFLCSVEDGRKAMMGRKCVRGFLVLTGAVVAGGMIVGGTVLADTPQDLNGGNLQLLRSYSVGVNGGVHISAASPGSTYSNVTNFTGFDYANGGAGPDPANAANTITTLVADDIHMLGAATITQFTFSVSNDSADQDTSARPRVRFYQTNGAGGGPGTNITGFSFNPIAFTHNSVGLFTG